MHLSIFDRDAGDGSCVKCALCDARETRFRGAFITFYVYLSIQIFDCGRRVLREQNNNNNN